MKEPARPERVASIHRLDIPHNVKQFTISDNVKQFTISEASMVGANNQCRNASMDTAASGNNTRKRQLPKENEHDNAGWKLRYHPSLKDATKKYSNRMLDILIDGDYVTDPTTVLEFKKGKYDDGINASVVYGLFYKGKLIDIGSSANFTQRIKFRKEECGDDWQHYEIRCLVYMDGIDLKTDRALQEIYVEMMNEITNDSSVPSDVRNLYHAYRERELDRLGARKQFVIQMVEMAMQRKYKCKVVGEAFSYDDELHSRLCTEVFDELHKLDPYMSSLKSTDNSDGVIKLAEMAWKTGMPKDKLSTKHEFTKYVGVTATNIDSPLEAVYPNSKGAAKIFAQQPDSELPKARQHVQAFLQCGRDLGKSGKRAILYLDRNSRLYPDWRVLQRLITEEYGFTQIEVLFKKPSLDPRVMPGLIVTFQLQQTWLDVHMALSVAGDSRGIIGHSNMLQCSQAIETLRLHGNDVAGEPRDPEMKAIAGGIARTHMSVGLHQHPLRAAVAIRDFVTEDCINATEKCAIPKAPANNPLHPSSKRAKRELNHLEDDENYCPKKDFYLQHRMFCRITHVVAQSTPIDDLVKQIDELCSHMPDGTKATASAKRTRWKSAKIRLQGHELYDVFEAACETRGLSDHALHADEVMSTLVESNAVEVVNQIDGIFSFEPGGITAVLESTKSTRWNIFMKRQKDHSSIHLIEAERARLRLCDHALRANEVMSTLTEEANVAKVVKQIDSIFSFEPDGINAVPASTRSTRWNIFMKHQKDHPLFHLIELARETRGLSDHALHADEVMSTLTEEANVAKVVKQIDSIFSLKPDGINAVPASTRSSRWNSFKKRQKDHPLFHLIEPTRKMGRVNTKATANKSDDEKGAHEKKAEHGIVQIAVAPGTLGIGLSSKEGQYNQTTYISVIQRDSPLAGKVNVGDVLIAINGNRVTDRNSVKTMLSGSRWLLQFKAKAGGSSRCF